MCIITIKQEEIIFEKYRKNKKKKQEKSENTQNSIDNYKKRT